MYKYSYFELIGGLVGLSIAIAASYRYRSQWKTYSIVVGLILVGIASVILSCLLNSISTNQWDTDSITAFLQLRMVGSWLYRTYAFMGYIFVLWGITVLILLKMRRSKIED